MATFFPFPKDGGPHSRVSVGQALAGLVARDDEGLPRVGMLAVPDVSAVASSWLVEVGRFVHVHHDDGAVQFTGLSDSEQVEVTSAADIPAGQARIDRIGWDASASELVVLEGVVSASPVAPGLGALYPVAQVRVDSGDGMLSVVKVSPEFVRTHGDASVFRGSQSLVLSGAVGSAGGNSWRSFVSVPFGRTFSKPPHLDVSAVFPSASVSFLEVTSVTTTGFSGRVVRIAHPTPVAGVVHWTATEV